ncbi:MAG: spore germination protein [Clostridia bacterium]|nr:spore germination protein [Clostridia bacterium]
MNDFRKSLDDNADMMRTLLRVSESYDMIVKQIKISDRKAMMFCVDGFTKDEMLEKMLEHLEKIPASDFGSITSGYELADNYVPYIETSVETDADKVVKLVLSGAICLLVEDIGEAIIIDSRTYPARPVQEPEADKVLRGSHEGFVETLVFNTALIRRRVRDTNLTLKLHQVGYSSKTDVIVCYIDGKADKKLLKKISDKLDSINVDALAMGQESLKECLIPYQPLNPYPKVRYTERPDTAAACLNDGNILILCDGTPSAIIIPTGIFDFVQDINDYYFTPVVGTFLRYIRVIVFFLSMFLTPVWYVIVTNLDSMPKWLDFLYIQKPNNVPIIIQLLIIEFVVDTLKLASLNTPSALSHSFSVVGALVLGEFAVESGLFVSETVLFMAFIAISSYTQPSYELGYAIKLSRIFILILSAIFGIWGFLIGTLLVIICVCTTKTVGGYTYLYPVIPFNADALKGLLYRRRIKSDFSRKK